MLSHAAFVLLSYGASLLVFAVVLAWLLIDRAVTRRELERLEKAGFRRRSDTGETGRS